MTCRAFFIFTVSITLDLLQVKKYYSMFSRKFYTDLAETFNSYYDSVIALFPKLLIALILFIVVYFIAVIVEKVLMKWLKKSLEDQLLAKFISKTSKIIIITSAILMCLKLIGLGALVTGILGTAGVGAFVLGFAFKDIGEHFLAGVLLAFNRPFRVGDTVELDGIKGSVSSLSLRNTRIKSFDGQDIFIPNGNIIKNKVINYTLDGYYRYDFKVILDNDVNVPQTLDLIHNELKNVTGILQDIKNPSVIVTINETNNLVFTILYWLNTDDKSISAGSIKNNAITQVAEMLLKKGYKMRGNTIEVSNQAEITK